MADSGYIHGELFHRHRVVGIAIIAQERAVFQRDRGQSGYIQAFEPSGNLVQDAETRGRVVHCVTSDVYLVPEERLPK